MRSSLIIQVNSKSKINVFIRDTWRRGESLVKIEAENGIYSHKPKNTWSQQTLKEARKDSSLEPCQQLDFGFLASRTLKESISIVSSHQISGNLLQLSQETNTQDVYILPLLIYYYLLLIYYYKTQWLKITSHTVSVGHEFGNSLAGQF